MANKGERTRNKIHNDRWANTCDKRAAFYRVADEKFIRDR